jgi:uncharacterized protein
MIDRPDLCAIAPEPDSESAWFWEALADDVLLVPECTNGHRFFPPMPSCPHCATTELTRVEASGRGSVYSWVTIHVALDPAFTGDVPYTILAVDLDGGGRMMGRLLDPALGELRAGAPVELTAYRVGDIVVPGFQFRPASTSDDAAITNLKESHA